MYRKIFLDLDHFGDVLVKWVPQAANILEVGCGEGAMTERLAARYPNASITSIDISPRIGRLYRGPQDRVVFQQARVEDVASQHAGEFDLVVLCDVLHHVPAEQRASLLGAIRKAACPRGSFVLKDWTPAFTPIHALCFSMERFVTGDRVKYPSASTLIDLVQSVFGADAIKDQAFVKPWNSNLAFLIR